MFYNDGGSACAQNQLWPFGADALVLFLYDGDGPLSWFSEGKIFRTVTGFTGSYGVCCVSPQVCFFASDSRYTIQAQQEVAEGCKCFTISPGSGDLMPFIPEMLACGCKKVIVISDFITVRQFDKLRTILTKSGISLEELAFTSFVSQLLSAVKGVQNEPRKLEELLNFQARLPWVNEETLNELSQQRCAENMQLPVKEAHFSFQEKVSMFIRKARKVVKGEEVFLITNRNLVSWITNRRKKDAQFNMNVEQDMLISLDDSVSVVGSKADYESLKGKFRRVVIDPKYTSLRKYSCIVASGVKVCGLDLPELDVLPNIKTDMEMANIIESHIADGVAMAKFLQWLYSGFLAGSVITEFDAAEKALAFRKEDQRFFHLSFRTISAMGANGAIVHYSDPSKDVFIRGNGIYLIDSGAHYFYGTTDITRSVAVGAPTKEQKLHYTVVLKAHIAVATCRFAQDVPSKMIDKVCRDVMLEYGLEFGHSVGHGIGYFSTVHEGPAAISGSCAMPLCVGMLLSNEPGYYEEGKHGIRLENVMRVVLASDIHSDCNMLSPHNLRPEIRLPPDVNLQGAGELFFGTNELPNSVLAFETISLAPFDKSLIDASILTSGEVEWLNKYHEKVRKTLRGKLPRKVEEWVVSATSLVV